MVLWRAWRCRRTKVFAGDAGEFRPLRQIGGGRYAVVYREVSWEDGITALVTTRPQRLERNRAVRSPQQKYSPWRRYLAAPPPVSGAGC